MPTVAIVIIVVVVVAAVALVVLARTAARRRQLRERFGPEYDRAVAENQSQLKAEAELAGRERRVRQLEIRPLTATSRAKYAGEWTAIQERFVDQPRQAVEQAQQLVVSVMDERGYPTEDPGQIMADLSVEHAQTLDNFRAAQEISGNASTASTEDLRQAMVHYRTLFSGLLGQPEEAQDTAAGDPPAARVPADGLGNEADPRTRR